MIHSLGLLYQENKRLAKESHEMTNAYHLRGREFKLQNNCRDLYQYVLLYANRRFTDGEATRYGIKVVS